MHPSSVAVNVGLAVVDLGMDTEIDMNIEVDIKINIEVDIEVDISIDNAISIPDHNLACSFASTSMVKGG
jgi:hypothetical protein